MQRYYHLFQSLKQASLRNTWNRYCMWFIWFLLGFCQCKIFWFYCTFAAQAQARTSGTTHNMSILQRHLYNSVTALELTFHFQWYALLFECKTSFSAVWRVGASFLNTVVCIVDECASIWNGICSALTQSNVFLFFFFPVFFACSSSWR